ncbi:MAG: NUDIX domain-containing protein [Chloroflexi bacterium]|nr:NUDIX domain-containing protein [Chloroflexota bacterium]
MAMIACVSNTFARPPGDWQCCAGGASAVAVLLCGSPCAPRVVRHPTSVSGEDRNARDNGPMRYCPHCATALVWREEARRQRPSCPVCGFIHYEDPKLVAVAVISIGGKLVLGRRAINPRIGYWSFPAGYVDRYEAVDAALIREVQEETCLVVEVEHLLGLYSEAGNPVVLAAYAARSVGGALVAADEVSEVGLFAPDRLPELAFPNDERILEDWLAYRRQPMQC